MKVALMQPYFLPYIGYWQLINCVDCFIIYDDCQYIKQGWVNRNRFINNGSVSYFTLPVSKGSMRDLISEKRIQAQWFNKEKKKVIKSVMQSYGKVADQYLIDKIINILDFECEVLSDFLKHSIDEICKLLEINTNIILSSSLEYDRGLKADDKIIKMCNILDARDYVNTVGGKELYKKEDFKKKGVNLFFIESSIKKYQQVGTVEFHPYLSVIDVMLNCGLDKTKDMLNAFQIS